MYGETRRGTASRRSHTAAGGPRFAHRFINRQPDQSIEDGSNVTASSAEALTKLATKYLIAAHARAFAFSQDERKFIDLLIALLV